MMRAPFKEVGLSDTTLPVDLERRRISALAALTLLGAPTITIVGCGGGGGSSPAAAPPPTTTPPPAASCPSGSACGQVSVDPQHRAEITAAQLTAGAALELDIRGSSTHNHTISLTADEVVAIRERRQVVKLSSTTLNHDHSVVFN